MTFSAAFIYQKIDAINGYIKELGQLLNETSNEDFFLIQGNFIYHISERLDQDMFIRNLRAHFADFEGYTGHIVSYLKKNVEN